MSKKVRDMLDSIEAHARQAVNIVSAFAIFKFKI